MRILEMSALALAFASACKQSEKKQPDPTPTRASGASGAGTPDTDAGGSAPATGEQTGTRQIEAPPPPKLHDKPVERRLYSDRIEASSFLWTDWNKFQENYHPNYIMDGDPATAWVEGADSSGAGEWVRIHVSPVEGASKIRLRIRNGYHKSKALHGKNARLKKVELVALPSGTKHTVEVADSLAWQEVAFEQPPGKLEAVELRAVEVVEGSKYTDLCVSDVELYVTGLTVENPAFEKSKLDGLLAWKQKRIAAAKLLGGAAANELPILAGYRVTRGDDLKLEAPRDGKPYDAARGTLGALARGTVGSGVNVEAANRALAALEGKFAGWVKIQLVARAPLQVPDVDGLRAAVDDELVFGGASDTLLLPETETHGSLVRSAHLSTFDTKGDNPIDDHDCKPGTSAFVRAPRKPDDGPVLRELLHVQCVTEETREGEARYMVWQLLEYDAEGNLVLTVGPHSQVQWFEWKAGERGAVLVAGGRLDSNYDTLMTLAAVDRDGAKP